jgi:hypothetical protein
MFKTPFFQSRSRRSSPELLGAQACANQGGSDGPEARVELGGDRLDLVPIGERLNLPVLVEHRPLVLDAVRRVSLEQPQGDGLTEHLPERSEVVVPRPRRQLRAPGVELVRRQLVDRLVAEGSLGVGELVAHLRRRRLVDQQNSRRLSSVIRLRARWQEHP